MQELADIARMQLGQTQQGFPGAPQQGAQRGWEAEPQPIRQGNDNPVSYRGGSTAMAGQREAMLRNQIAIAERHPDLRGCMNDQVIFLAGGNRVLPFPNLMTLTVDQADAMVATLRSG